jgi:hypothetical protein
LLIRMDHRAGYRSSANRAALPWGSSSLFAMSPPAAPRTPADGRGDDRLAAVVGDVDLLVLDDHALLALGLELLERERRSLIDIEHPRRCVDESNAINWLQPLLLARLEQLIVRK